MGKEPKWMDVEDEARRVTQEIFRERLRQVDNLGYSWSRDDKYTEGELALAAAGYANPEDLSSFPWATRQRNRLLKKKRREQLVIAAALIVAEIERMDRAEDK